jgi:PAS domain S-box-containing protein
MPSSPFAVVVNDDPAQLELLSGLVRSAGLEAHAFTAAEAALARMSAGARAADGDPGALPALIVTGLRMPDLDVWRFCRLLRSPEYAALNHIPVLVSSAVFAGEAPVRVATDLGADAYFASPLDGRRFAESVQEILKGRQVRSPARVLIAGDGGAVAAGLKLAFEASGYAADTASTVRAATDAFSRAAYDVAVLDHHLPGGGGDALLDAFRAGRTGCVCVMLTADPGPELALDWMKRGAAAYLHEPFEPGELVELCERARRARALLQVQDLLEVRTRELRESEAKCSRAFQTSPHAIIITRVEDGGLVEVNDAFTSMTGFTREEALADPAIGLKLWVDEGDRQRVLSALGTGRAVAGQALQFRTRSGEIIRGLLSAQVLRLGQDPCVLCSIADITGHQLAEEESARLGAQLRQAQKMEAVGRLAGGVAHDFNNMLGVILGHAQLALRRVGPEQPVHASLTEIHKAASRSAALTRQLLGFARRQTVAPRVLDLNETVTGMLQMLERLIGEDIGLHWRPGADLWPVRVDPSQIDQVMANLCVNARDAISDGGKLTIETRNCSLNQEHCATHAGFVPGEYVLLAVSDDGCGMGKETLARLFEPFFTTKETGKGTGLGLATVYGIVKQNHGFIYVVSEPGSGTTFTIYLPRHVGGTEPVRTEGAAVPAARGQETILLVEDEPAILEMVTAMLEMQGYTVLGSSTPGEAIRLARERAGEVHLLMTDVVMPGMNGRELARNLLSIRPHLKRLFMSGYTAEVIAHHGVLDEGVHFIQKPFSIEDLAARVRETLADG